MSRRCRRRQPILWLGLNFWPRRRQRNVTCPCAKIWGERSRSKCPECNRGNQTTGIVPYWSWSWRLRSTRIYKVHLVVIKPWNYVYVRDKHVILNKNLFSSTKTRTTLLKSLAVSVSKCLIIVNNEVSSVGEELQKLINTGVHKITQVYEIKCYWLIINLGFNELYKV